MMGRQRWLAIGLGVLVAGSSACRDEVESVEEILPSVSAAEVVSVDLDDEIRGPKRLRFLMIHHCLHTLVLNDIR